MYSFFTTYLPKRRNLILANLLILLLTSIVSIAQPHVLKMITDAIIAIDLGALRTAAFWAGGITIAFTTLNCINKPLSTHITNMCQQDIQIKLIDTIFSMKKIRLNQLSHGDIITKATQNTDEAVSKSLTAFFGMFGGACVVVAGVLYMGYLNIWLMIAVVVYNVLLKAIFDGMYQRIQAQSKALVGVTKRNNAFLIDIINNLFVIRAFGRQEYFYNKLKTKEEATLGINTKLALWYNIMRFFVLFMNKITEFVFCYGIAGFLMLRGHISFGAMVAFTLAIDMFVKGLNSFVRGLSDKAVALPNIENITTFIEEPLVENEPHTLLPAGTLDSIKFQNVSFAHGEKEILNCVNFEIKVGEKILLIGGNGQGKSTLLKLITGLYRPDSGQIFYGKQDTTQTNIETMADHYCYISQDSCLVGTDVLSNMTFLQAGEYDLDTGNATLGGIGISHNHRAQTLSQGEKQRLNISRALYKLAQSSTPFMIIGDEIFSNIDNANRDIILHLLEEKYPHKIVIMICHDDIPYKFDRILQVESGSVVEVQA